MSSPIAADSTSSDSAEMDTDRLKTLIRDVRDFPKTGIIFRDITPLLRDAVGLSTAIDRMVEPFAHERIDLVIGPESRGFIFAAAVAHRLSCGFVPVRKPGRLPWKVASQSYQLEYGQDALEIHVDAIQSGHSVLLVDDLLATGGTMAACVNLVRTLGGTIVGASFLVELDGLDGRKQLSDLSVHSVLHFAEAEYRPPQI